MISSNGHSHNGQVIDAVSQHHDNDAERAVLGGILIDPSAYYDVADFLEDADFYIGKNRLIYKAMRALLANGADIDIVTLASALRAAGETDESYVIGLITAVPTSINTRNYGRIVRSHSLRRRLRVAAGKIVAAADDSEQSIDTAIEKSESALFEVTGKAATNSAETIRDGMTELITVINARRDSGSQIVGLQTGYIDLDHILQGMEGGELYTFAGRPGMGKSLFEAGVSLYNGHRGKHVARFNMEMSAEQIWQRMASIESGIPLTRLRRGDFSDKDMQAFMEAVGRLSELKMWLDDSAGMSLSQLSAKCRRLHAEHGLDLITVDYLQLMVSNNNRYGNRTQEVGAISRGLKRLAKDLNVPILALAQLSRACEQRGDKRPMLSDLRDSGDIEQDSDVVMFIYRDDYYNPDTSERPNVAEVNVAKHRNGPVGIADLYFKAETPKLSNLQKREIIL